MAKFNFKRFFALCLGIVLLLMCIGYSERLSNPGYEYTETYEVYKDMQKLTSIKDVETYLDNKNISYIIYNNKLTISGCSSIAYIINPSDGTGYLRHSIAMYNFSRLDARNLDVITVEKEVINGNIQETICLKENGFSYTKIGNHYYIEPTTFYRIMIVISFFAAIIILPIVIIDYISVFFDWLKERQDKKKLNNTNSETNPEKEDCKS